MLITRQKIIVKQTGLQMVQKEKIKVHHHQTIPILLVL